MATAPPSLLLLPLLISLLFPLRLNSPRAVEPSLALPTLYSPHIARLGLPSQANIAYRRAPARPCPVAAYKGGGSNGFDGRGQNHTIGDSIRTATEAGSQERLSRKGGRRGRAELAGARNLSNPSGLPWTTSVGGEGIEMFFMKYLEKLFETLNESGLELETIPTPPEFLSQHSQPTVANRARVGCVCFKTKDGTLRRARVEYVDSGPKAQILNALFYPSVDNPAPILGIDLLSFNQGSRILVGIDFHPLSQDAKYIEEFVRPLEDIKMRYPELQGEVSNRIYDSFEYFSPGMLFGRLESPSSLETRVFEAYEAAVKAYLKVLAHGSKDCWNCQYNPAWVSKRQQAYNRYNYENDPAAGIFAANFGKDWSERFMSEFLFEQIRHSSTLQISEFGNNEDGKN